MRSAFAIDIPAVAPAPSGLNLERIEQEAVERALRKHSYIISRTVTELGLSRFALYRRMEKHGF